jgi:hypothetical protein
MWANTASVSAQGAALSKVQILSGAGEAHGKLKINIVDDCWLRIIWGVSRALLGQNYVVENLNPKKLKPWLGVPF